MGHDRSDADSNFYDPPGEKLRGLNPADDWDIAVEACAAYVESRYPPGVNAELAASLRKFKRKHKGELDA